MIGESDRIPNELFRLNPNRWFLGTIRKESDDSIIIEAIDIGNIITNSTSKTISPDFNIRFKKKHTEDAGPQNLYKILNANVGQNIRFIIFLQEHSSESPRKFEYIFTIIKNNRTTENYTCELNF